VLLQHLGIMQHRIALPPRWEAVMHLLREE
jgi:hypothetical protein